MLKQVVLGDPAVCAGDAHANTASGATGCTVSITRRFNTDSVKAIKTLHLTSFVDLSIAPPLPSPTACSWWESQSRCLALTSQGCKGCREGMGAKRAN